MKNHFWWNRNWVSPRGIVVDIVKTTEEAFVKSYNSEQARSQQAIAELTAYPVTPPVAARVAAPKKKMFWQIRQEKRSSSLIPAMAALTRVP